MSFGFIGLLSRSFFDTSARKARSKTDWKHCLCVCVHVKREIVIQEPKMADGFDFMALFGALRDGSDSFRSFLEQDIFLDPEVRTQAINDLVECSVFDEDVDCLKILINEYGVDIHEFRIMNSNDPRGDKLLKRACLDCQPEVVQFLLSVGAEADEDDLDLMWWTFSEPNLLDYPPGKGDQPHLKIVRLLHEANAAPLVNFEGYPIIMQRVEIVDWVLEAIASDKEQSQNVGFLLGTTESRSYDKSTLWHVAMKHHHWEMTEIYQKEEWCEWETISYFLKEKIAHHLINEPNDAGNTPLHLAIRLRAPASICKDLVEIGKADLFARNCAGTSCLELAKELAEKEQIQEAARLMDAGEEESTGDHSKDHHDARHEGRSYVARYEALLNTLPINKLHGLTNTLFSFEGYIDAFVRHHRGSKGTKRKLQEEG